MIAIFIAVWIYKDAEKRGKSGALWVVILLLGTLLLSIIGTVIVIVIWLMVRPPEMYGGYGPGPYRDGPPPRDYDRDYPPPRERDRDYAPPRDYDRRPDYPPPRGYEDDRRRR